MNVEVRNTKDKTAATQTAIIDCDIHPSMKNPTDARKYLPKRWQEHYDQFGTRYRQPFSQGHIYPRAAPYLSRRDAMPPSGGPPGSDLAFMGEQLLDAFNIQYGVLQVLEGGDSQRNVEYGAELCTALNLWQIDEWLDKDKRLRGSIVVTPEYPEAAIAEIERFAKDPRFVQVSLLQRNQEPNGRRRYWPILEAAEAHDLVVGIHTGGYSGHPPVAGSGWPSYYAEQHHLIAIAMQACASSLVMEGVFERFPKLRVIMVEGGFSWVPALGWRLDKLWEKLRAEVPHLKRPPSEYLREHCWFSTQPVDDTEKPQHLRQIIDWIGWDRLCFATDYPHWDFDDPRYAFPIGMNASEKAAIFHDNAARLFKLS
jgi:predicted TIM-barrel fold metal-dependent hydrolase